MSLVPLFTLDEHGNYVQVPVTDPIYRIDRGRSSVGISPSLDRYQPHTGHRRGPSSSLASIHDHESFVSFLFSGVSWSGIRDLVIKPFLSGLAFGIGSYASRYLVHYIMIHYSDWHQIPTETHTALQHPPLSSSITTPSTTSESTLDPTSAEATSTAAAIIAPAYTDKITRTTDKG